MDRPTFVLARAGASLLAFLAVSFICLPAHATTLDFEDLPLGQQYDLNAGTPTIPDSFVTNGVPVQLAEFFLLPSGSTTSGSATVLDSVANPFSTAGGSGNYMFMGNVNLDFQLPGPASELSFLFGEFGGNLNLRVNGDLANVSSFFSLPATLGGANVTVDSLGSTISGDLGRVTLTGNITSMIVGGQEFSIDDVIIVPEPSTCALASIGLVGLFAAVWRNRRLRRG